jgi:hypothetical protein
VSFEDKAMMLLGAIICFGLGVAFYGFLLVLDAKDRP